MKSGWEECVGEIRGVRGDLEECERGGSKREGKAGRHPHDVTVGGSEDTTAANHTQPRNVVMRDEQQKRV